MRVLFLGFAFAVAASAQTAAPHFVEVPLQVCGGMPCVQMSTQSGKTLMLILDLGEPNSYLDAKAAQSLSAEVKPMKAEGDANIPQVQQTIVPGAKIGDLPMGDFPFTVLDTTPSSNQLNAKQIPPFPADGVMAFRAFDNRIVAIDYADHKVRISEPLDTEQQCPHACTQLVVKHVGKFGPVTLTIDGFAVNGQAVQAQIDTMWPGTMLIYQDFVKDLGLKKMAKGKQKQFFPFLLNGVKLAQADGATLTYNGTAIGSETALFFFDKEDAHEDPANFTATVGSGLFQTGTAVFDFKGKHFWLEQK